MSVKEDQKPKKSALGARLVEQGLITEAQLAQGREDCGTVAVGARADLILIDLNAINNIPCYDLATALAYSVNTSNVLLTMCDGRILFENGEYTSIDIECLRFESRQIIRHYFD